MFLKARQQYRDFDLNFNTYRQLFSSLYHWPVFSLCCFLLSLQEILFHFVTVSTMTATCESFVIKVLAPLMAWMVNLSLAWTNAVSKQ